MTKAEQVCECGHLISGHGFDAEGNVVCTGCDCIGGNVSTSVKTGRAATRKRAK